MEAAGIGYLAMDHNAIEQSAAAKLGLEVESEIRLDLGEPSAAFLTLATSHARHGQDLLVGPICQGVVLTL